MDVVLGNQEVPGNNEALAYFYCKQGEAQLDEPEAILRSFVRQLSFKTTGFALQQPVISAYETSMAAKKFDDGLGIQQCVDLIIELANVNLQTTLIIDALDECDNDKRDDLFRALRQIVGASTSLVKVFISSRNEGDIAMEFERELQISIGVEDNSADIELYVRTEVARWIKDKKLMRGEIDDALKELVISRLLEKAGGMYWIPNICELPTSLIACK